MKGYGPQAEYNYIILVPYPSLQQAWNVVDLKL